MFNVLGASGICAFAMAWAIGAQDVSNALGTSVGSKALTVRQAIFVGAVFEFLGSLMGGAVASTISKGVISPDAMRDEIELYVLIMFATLAGAFVWLAVATYFCLPVSTTHSMIGSLVGLGLLHVPIEHVNVATLQKILVSWVTSPLLGFAISYSVFYIIHSRILTAPDPKQQAIRYLPSFYGGTGGVLVLFLFSNGPAVLRMPFHSAFIVAAVACVALAIGVERYHLPGRTGAASKDKSSPANRATPAAEIIELGVVVANANDSAAIQKIEGEDEEGNAPPQPPPAQPTAAGAAAAVAVANAVEEKPHDDDGSSPSDEAVEDAEKLFGGLMVTTACVVAFAHGSNDVSNSIGPFAAIVEIYDFGVPSDNMEQRPVPLWILMTGGFGIVVGLSTYGYKVMATVGEKITKLTFTRGYAAQIATALTVLGATLVGLSVSTTHCLIGAVTGVGLVESIDKLNLAVIRRIAISWVVTLPASALFSIILYWLVVTFDKILI